MSPEFAIVAALAVPLLGALLIGLAGRVNDNLRESLTLMTALALIVCVWSLVPEILAGGRPGVNLMEVLPPGCGWSTRSTRSVTCAATGKRSRPGST